MKATISIPGEGQMENFGMENGSGKGHTGTRDVWDNYKTKGRTVKVYLITQIKCNT